MTDEEPFEPAPTRPATMTCPGCKKTITCRESGHVNPHWVDDLYVCQEG